MRHAALIVLLVPFVGLTGCSHYFAASGALSSEGGDLGEFRSTPQGCSRDPVDHLPPSLSTTVLTMLWADPALRDIRLRDNNRFFAPNAPLRLEIAHDGDSYQVNLDTVRTPRVHFGAADCTTLKVETHQTPPSIAEGKPTLSGRVQLECGVVGSHVMADIPFERCEY